jgi:hypothetical protein
VEAFFHHVLLDQLLELMGRHIQIFQPLPGAFHQLYSSLADIFNGAVLERLIIVDGNQIFLLAGHQLGGINREQYFILFDSLPGFFDIQLFNPPLDLGVDAVQQFFIIGYPAHRPDLSVQHLFLRDCRPDPDVLLDHRINGHRTGRFPGGPVSIGIDGDIIHAHLVLGRRGRGDRRIHRIAVKQNFRLTLCAFGFLNRGGRLLFIGGSIPVSAGQPCQQGEHNQKWRYNFLFFH